MGLLDRFKRRKSNTKEAGVFTVGGENLPPATAVELSNEANTPAELRSALRSTPVPKSPTGPGGAGGGGGNSGGRPSTPQPTSSASDSQAKIDADRKIMEESRAASARAAEQQRTQQIAAQRAKDIERERQALINEGGRVTTKESVDAKTKQPITITEVKKNGKKIRTVTRKDGDTTTTTTNVYAPGKAGGSVEYKGGITTATTTVKQPILEDKKIDLFNDKSNLLVKGWNTLKDVNTQISERIPSFDELTSPNNSINSLNIKPFGYSRWTEERKKNWDEAMGNISASQKKDSQTYVPTTIRGGFEKLYTEIKEKPLLAGTAITTSVILAPATTIAGLGSIATGTDVFVGDLGKTISEKSSTSKYKDVQQFGGITGATLQGIGYLAPKSTTEVLLDATAVRYLPGLTKTFPLSTSTVLTGFGAYNIVEARKSTGEEKYGKYLMGVGAVAGAVPGFVVGARKVIALGSDNYIKTRPGSLGIPETKIDIVEKAVSQNRDLSFKELSTINTLDRPYGDLKIEFIPSQSETYTSKINPLKTLSSDINLKDTPSLPKTTDIQKEILQVVKEEGGIVSGSFAQESLVKDARPFQDLDILVKDPQRFKEALIKDIDSPFNYETKTITDSPMGKFDIVKIYDKKTRQHLADIDPIKFSEEGFGKMFEPIKVDGLKLLPPEVRLTSKIIQASRPLVVDKKLKVATDISQLTGNKDLLTSPSLLRGYGLSKAEQKAAYLGGDVIFTHGGQGIIPTFSDTIRVKGKIGDVFYGTSSTVKGGTAFTRSSRMFGSGSKGVSFIELLNPKNLKNLEFIPKKKDVIITTGRLGEEFVQPNKGTSEIEIGIELKNIIDNKVAGFDFNIVNRFSTIERGEAVNVAIVKLGGTADKTSKGFKGILNDVSKTTIDVSTSRTNIQTTTLIPTMRYSSFNYNIPIKTSIKTGMDESSNQGSKMYSIVSSQRIIPSSSRNSNRIRSSNITTRIIGKNTNTDTIRSRSIRDVITPRTPRRDKITYRFDRDIIRPTKTLKAPPAIKPVSKINNKSFGVQIRRYGQFRSLGSYKNLTQAFNVGRMRVSTGLGATFKITGAGKLPKAPKGFRTKQTSTGLEFIEKRKYRLSKTGEKKEIQAAKRSKPKKRKKKK